MENLIYESSLGWANQEDTTIGLGGGGAIRVQITHYITLSEYRVHIICEMNTTGSLEVVVFSSRCNL